MVRDYKKKKQLYIKIEGDTIYSELFILYVFICTHIRIIETKRFGTYFGFDVT